MKICVIGTGYVGLVTGTCLAETGNEVVCVDIDETKVKKMQGGHIPIYEPGLEDLFHHNIQEGRLQFSTKLAEGITKAEVIFLALPTPPGANGEADLSYVLGVADELGKLLKSYAVIVDKSTVPIGTAEQVRERIAQNNHTKFDVVSNPEFLREGFAVNDFMKPDRIVIGSSSRKAQQLMEELYGPFVRQGSELLIMDERSAEMTKYAANTFLATKISFMNEIANLCEQVGANVDSVRLGIGSDERIGKRFLMAGIGYGGSCFPKDVQALYRIAQAYDYDFKIVQAVEAVNNRQKQILFEKISTYYKDDLASKTFALWGLSFKPDTDDIREAPALEIIQHLTDKGARVVAFDPQAMEHVQRSLKQNKLLSFGTHPYEVLEAADALIIATEWPEFATPDFDRIKQLLKAPVIFDGRNLYEPAIIESRGFYYASIGRPVIEMKTT